MLGQLGLVLTTILVLLAQKKSVNAGSSHPCSMKWSNFLAGSELDETAVACQDGKFYVARRMGSSVGWMNKETGIGTFPATTGVYQVLTNPNDCAVEWELANFGEIPSEEQKFAVIGNNGYVARGKISGVPELAGQFLSGEILDRAGQKFLFIPYGGRMHENIAPRYLRSSKNLKLDMREFHFSETPSPGTEDFLGFDLIVNDSECEVKHTVTHKKTVKVSCGFTETQSFAETSTFYVGLNIPFPEGGINFEFNKTDWNSNTQTSEFLHEEENEVVSTRVIHVAPYSSVQACSVVTMENDLTTPYWTPGKYSVKGYNSNQVKQVLRGANYEDKDFLGVEGNSLIVNVTGTFKVTSPMRTTFIVLQTDDEHGCRELESKIMERKRIRTFGQKDKIQSEINRLNEEIRRIIHGTLSQ